jgi:hypothetical protein
MEPQPVPNGDRPLQLDHRQRRECDANTTAYPSLRSYSATRSPNPDALIESAAAAHATPQAVARQASSPAS